MDDVKALVARLRDERHLMQGDGYAALIATATQAADRIEKLEGERDEAQAVTSAWQEVFEGLEAHLKDRIAMRDEADPEAYLRILHGYVANIIRSSRQIVAARWADYDRHRASLHAAEAALTAERERGERTITRDELADALGCFWNAALYATHAYNDSTANAVMAGMVEGAHAIAERLKARAALTDGEPRS